jgi:hypothetical protein
MAYGGVEIRQFVPFGEGVEAAKLSGPAVEAAVDILKSRTPFGEGLNGDGMSIGGIVQAKIFAITEGDLPGIATEAGLLDDRCTHIVMSRT